MNLTPGVLNNMKFASASFGLYNLLTAFSGAHWPIRASGDALLSYNSNGNTFTTASAGTKGFDNVGAWFRVGYPSGTAELMFVRGSTTDAYACVALSLTGGFTINGSATQAPSASDQQMILGTGLTPTQASNWSGANGTLTYYNAVVDADPPYNFWLGGILQAAGGDAGGIASDTFSNFSSGSGGVDPQLYMYAGTVNMWSGYSFSAWKSWSAGTWGAIGSTWNGTFGRSDSTGNQYLQGSDLIPVMIYCAIDGSHSFVRGYSTQMLLDFQSPAKVNHSLGNYSGSLGNRILMGNFSVPWPSGTAVITS